MHGLVVANDVACGHSLRDFMHSPVILLGDRDYRRVDQNTYRVSNCLFQPTFRAVLVMNEGTESDDTNLVVNSNSLHMRKLLEFAVGE